MPSSCVHFADAVVCSFDHTRRFRCVLANAYVWTSLQVRGEPFGAWRAPRVRMPKRAAPKPRRPRSPPRRRGEDSSERFEEETPTDDEVVERRTKMRHDPLYANRVAREKPTARTPHKRRGRVVSISSEEEDEEDHLDAQGGDELDLQQKLRYVRQLSFFTPLRCNRCLLKLVPCIFECLLQHVDVLLDIHAQTTRNFH